MYEIQEIAALIRKYSQGTITPSEQERLQQWAQDKGEVQRILEHLREDAVGDDVRLWLSLHAGKTDEDWIDRLEQSTFQKIHEAGAQACGPAACDSTTTKTRQSRILRLLPYAACVIVLASAVWLFQTREPAPKEAVVLQDLQPGTNSARVTLSNGKVFQLSNARAKVVTGQGITYDDGSSIYDPAGETTLQVVVETPRGGSYQIQLPDGTNVWLNAESKLSYPMKFSATARQVELQGEAFFDVRQISKNDKRVPFILKTNKQEVEVLGTQFNVMAYLNEKAEQTTLVTGQVRVTSGTQTLALQPGEQATAGKSMKKASVDPAQYIAWKDNMFFFRETELREAMRTLGRWYNFETVYENEGKQTHFYGMISRKKGLAEVLAILEAGGLRFRIEKTGQTNQVIVLN